MTKVAINGFSGRMGQSVANTVIKDEEMELVCGIDKIIKEENRTVPVYNNAEEINENVDVIIDFSIPEATFMVLDYAEKNHIPVVIATTGFSKEQEEKIREYSKNIPIFKSSNMSIDINLMCKIVAEIAKKLKGNDIEIIETHHNRKIDSPSGTAIMLGNAINEALDNQMHFEFNRMNKRERRSKDEIGFSSIRGGNIVGEHTVQFFSDNESFEIKHTSYSSKVFAEGAIKAAKFIVNQPNGMYNMNNILN